MTMSSPLQALRSSEVSEQDRAWRQVFDREFYRCYRLVLRSGVPGAEAEELVQKVFMVALRRVREMESIDNIGAWLRRITLNIINEHYRWYRVRRLRAWMLSSVPGASPGDLTTPEEAAQRAEVQHRVHEVLSSMSAKLRDVLILIEMDGLKPQEAAEVLGCPTNTVRSRRRLAALEFEKRWRALDATRAR